MTIIQRAGLVLLLAGLTGWLIYFDAMLAERALGLAYQIITTFLTSLGILCFVVE